MCFANTNPPHISHSVYRLGTGYSECEDQGYFREVVPIVSTAHAWLAEVGVPIFLLFRRCGLTLSRYLSEGRGLPPLRGLDLDALAGKAIPQRNESVHMLCYRVPQRLATAR
jgi:hypothetical protein